ncbi:MAG TPA: PEP-CTERM sorting domain-containing protein [Pyrinomonadaceae bacterium]|nr:PEP-CTERM sorting domain-containing protein [Pyrinomonadaceae bacterium]
MKKLLVSLAALVVLGLSSSAKADTLTYTPTPSDLNDLDHHSVYTWRVDNVNLNGKTITGARITFTNIANWDINANRLYIHLLDTAKAAGVSSFVDDPTGSTPVTDFTDDFVSTRYHNQSSWLVANGTADTHLHTYVDIGTTPSTLVYNFSASELSALFAYITTGTTPGSFALGFDPDCHFFNDGIKFEIFTSANTVPEPATMALLGTGLAGLYARRRRQQKKARREAAA